jgi:beta-1,2-mannobiose phosphorylase / 1,2-beta-oligomannan phosphorylase
MITKLGVILEKTQYAFESKGVLNPAIMQVGTDVHMFYRAFKKGNYSTLGYCRFEGPVKIVERKNHPVFYPDKKEEKQGVEDARLTKMDNTYYMTYTAYDGHNALGAVAVSTDLEKFDKLGVITPKVTFREYYNAIEGNKNLSNKYLHQYHFLVEHGLLDKVPNYLIWDKNLLLFPEKINGKFALLHRMFPGIQIVYFNDFADLTTDFWIQYLFALDEHIVMDPAYGYETSHIGGGCPPIRTPHGWLLIYHAVEVTTYSNVYHMSAAILDINDPKKVIARLKKPLASPEHEWEKRGYVNNVCFPTGTAIFNEDLYIYYGAADSTIAVAKINMNELLNDLVTNNAWTYDK